MRDFILPSRNKAGNANGWSAVLNQGVWLSWPNACVQFESISPERFVLTVCPKDPVPLIFTHVPNFVYWIPSVWSTYCCFCFLTVLWWGRTHNVQHTMHNGPVSNNEFVFPGYVAAHWLSSPPLVWAESPSLVSGRTNTAEFPPTIGKMNTRVHATSYLRQMQVSWEPFKAGFRWEMKISLAFAVPLFS